MKKRVSTVVVVDDKKFLILRRGPESLGGGLWNFPGGKAEAGEKAEETAVRELKEESDLDVKPEDLEYLGSLETKKLIVTFFITDLYEGEVKINKESDKFKWIPITEIENYTFVGGGSIHPNLIFEIGRFIYGG